MFSHESSFVMTAGKDEETKEMEGTSPSSDWPSSFVW